VAQERKEDKKIQKKYTHTIIFPLLNNKDFFPSYKKFNKDFLSLFLSQNSKKKKTPHLGFSFFTYDTLNRDKREKKF